MDAILSDIHGNFEALTAVLASAREHGAKRIICLGDIVGDGPDPAACAEALLDCDIFVDVIGTSELWLPSRNSGWRHSALRAALAADQPSGFPDRLHADRRGARLVRAIEERGGEAGSKLRATNPNLGIDDGSFRDWRFNHFR